MNDHPDFTPTLTLNPTLDSSAPAAPATPTPAPQEAMAEIQLSLQEQQMVPGISGRGGKGSFRAGTGL